jgi:hypothetical protein
MNAAMVERINELEAEVRVLKRALAEAHGKLAGCETEKPSQASIGRRYGTAEVEKEMAAAIKPRRARAKAKRATMVQFEG